MRNLLPAVLSATLLSSTMVLAACGGGPEAPTGETSPGASSTGAASTGESVLGPNALVSYAFLDSSVPPPYHRSYELTVRADESRIVVDSYGDVLAQERVATDPTVWSTLGATIEEVTSLSAQQPEEGCTGGTVTSLTVVREGDVLVDLVLDQCADVNIEAVEVVNSWIAPAREQFPPMDVLAPEGE